MRSFLAILSLLEQLVTLYREWQAERELKERIQVEIDKKRILIRKTADEIEAAVNAMPDVPDYMRKYQRD